MTASGRPFQTWAAAPGKARLPTVDSLMGGATRRLVLADCRARRPGRSATVRRGRRYRGALSCRTLYVSTAILYCTRSGTRSQCSVVNASVMWSCGRRCRRTEHRLQSTHQVGWGRLSRMMTLWLYTWNISLANQGIELWRRCEVAVN